MTQATPASEHELLVHQVDRRVDFAVEQHFRLQRRRELFIYTRQGVLDMTRRHKLEEVVIDRFGQRGGATW